MAPLLLYALSERDAARIEALCGPLGVACARVASLDAARDQAAPHALLIAPAARLRADEVAALRERLPTINLLLIGDEAPPACGDGIYERLPAAWSEAGLVALITRWRTTSEREERLSEMITLMELGQLLTQTLELDELYEQIIALVDRAFEPDGVSLMMVEDEGRALCLVARRGGQPAPGMTVPITADTIAATVARERLPQLLLGGLDGTRFEHLARGNVGSSMIIPLVMKDETIGVLNVSRSMDRPPYSEADATLVQVVAHQIAIALHNARLYENLRAERDRIVRAQEVVRRELARDLHDGLGQVLATLSVNLRNLHALLERGAIGPGELLDDLTFLSRVARQAVQDARTLTFGLRPLILETQGLASALRRYLQIIGEGGSGLRYELEIDCAALDDLALESARTLFAVVQEAITNARKHASAGTVTISIGCAGEGSPPARVVARVRDDGIGFEQPSPDGEPQRVSFGLLNMRERAELLGGSFRIVSTPGGGTTVEVEIPWRSAQKEEEEE